MSIVRLVKSETNVLRRFCKSDVFEPRALPTLKNETPFSSIATPNPPPIDVETGFVDAVTWLQHGNGGGAKYEDGAGRTNYN